MKKVLLKYAHSSPNMNEARDRILFPSYLVDRHTSHVLGRLVHVGAILSIVQTMPNPVARASHLQKITSTKVREKDVLTS